MNQDNYVTLPTADGGGAVQSPQLVEIVAPSDLAEGYQFEAEANGQRFLVTVPQGGVKAGQRFTTKGAPISNAAADPVKDAAIGQGIVGAWKDGLFNCFRYGCCHAHFCLTLWCAPIALAQVMTRMRLNWLGEPGSVQQVASTFKTVVCIWVVYFVVSELLSIIAYALYPTLYETTHDSVGEFWATFPPGALFMYYLQRVWGYVFVVYMILATCRTRASIRDQYEIPETSCSGCEDCCCATFCGSCAIMQMMRHTADYDQHAATYCTETGLPNQIQTV